MESMGKKPRRRRSFTPDFKAEIVELCQRGDRSAARRNQPCTRARQDAELAAEIAAVHADSKGRYGVPRIHAALRVQGRRHSRKRVARLMRQCGLRGRAAKRWKKTTIADPAAAERADRIRRDFTADASKINTRWCGDITYLATWEGWLYLATVIDIASRRVVGYARTWPTKAGARRAVVEYIAWYNGSRLHSSLGYQSPADYENNRQVARPLVTFPWLRTARRDQPSER